MEHGKEIERLLKNLGNLAKRHDTELEIRLDGTSVAKIKLVPRAESGLKAIIGIKDFKKALRSPELLKAGLSLFALKKGPGKETGKIDIEIESGAIKRLFGRK